MGYFALNFTLPTNENIPIPVWHLGVTALIIIRRANYWVSLRWWGWGWGWGIVVGPVIYAIKYLSIQIWSLLMDLCLADSTSQDFLYKFCGPLYNFLYQFSMTFELNRTWTSKMYSLDAFLFARYTSEFSFFSTELAVFCTPAPLTSWIAIVELYWNFVTVLHDFLCSAAC